jgi:N-acetylneuraminic acid mutarotase
MLRRTTLTRSCWFAALYAALAIGSVHAQTTLTLTATNLFGGAGDQRATAAGIASGALYFSGVTAANAGDGLVASYALPMSNNAAPLWSANWPGLTGSDDFNGLFASTSGVYVAGSSFNRTTDTAGGKENKGITVKFPLTGATGGGFGGALWDRQTPAAPGALPYGGSEALWASLLTVEGGGTFAYVTGSGQANGANGGRLFVSKLDASGTVIWTRNDSANMINNAYSIGRGLAALNGNIYVSGFNSDSGNKAYLRKYDANGNLLWSRTTTTGSYIGVTALGSAIFAVGQVGSGVAANFLVDKWDEAGNLVWSQQYDRNGAEDFLYAVTGLGGRIYAAGSTRGMTAGGADAALLEFDPGTGNLLATKLYGGSLDDFANGIATDGTNLYVVGETRSFTAGGNSAGQNDAFVLRYAVAAMTSLAISPVNPGINVGSNLQFTATGTFSDGSLRTLTNNSAAASAWQTATPIPQSSYGLGGAFVGGKLYAVSGFATTRVAVYDPATKIWSTVAPLPQLLQYFGITTLGGKIYVAGGDTGGSGDRATLYRFDPALNTWTNLAPLPAGPRFAVRAEALNGKIYVVGGYNISSSTFLDRVEIYDPSNNTWATGTPLPAPRYSPMAGAINGKLYVAGGTSAGGALTNGVVFDPAGNAWTSIAAPIVAGFESVVLGGKLYGVTVGSSQTLLQMYDPVANNWTTNFPAAPTPRNNVGVAADEANGRIFVVAGYNGGYISALETIALGVPEVVWSSANPTVAEITTGGRASGRTAGTSVITATASFGSTNTLLSVLAPPSISMQPMNSTALANGSVTLSVTASGDGLSYQWLFNGTNLAGANGPTLTLSNLTASMAGVYSVVVSNAVDSVTSAPATLSLLNLNMFAGLTIVGQVGGTYEIDFRNNLNNTNWFNITNVVLPSSPYLFIDTDSPQYPLRFYRAVLVP